jgi:hypothetical protein
MDLALVNIEKRAKKLTFYGSLEPDRRTLHRYLAPARKAEWCVYAKPRFGHRAFSRAGRNSRRKRPASTRMSRKKLGRQAIRRLSGDGPAP